MCLRARVYWAFLWWLRLGEYLWLTNQFIVKDLDRLQILFKIKDFKHNEFLPFLIYFVYAKRNIGIQN